MAPLPHRPLVLFLALVLVSLLILPILAAKDYYRVMSVDRKASDRDIKRAYRKLAQKLHPDKFPEKADQFVELSEAYQVLSDAELRSIYDRFGEDAVKRHQQAKEAGQNRAPNDPMNIFQQFFGGGGQQQQQVRRGPGKQFNLEIGLADMYKGRTVSIEFQRRLLCPACDGSGARSKGDIHTCETCNGQGVRVVRQQIMPGFVTNAQITCERCGGQGRVISHACDKCGGVKTVVEQSEIAVEIEPGAEEGEEIVFEGEADESPEYEAGDVVFKLRSGPQKGDLRRRHHNLYMTQPISLADALLGFASTFSHYDGHPVLLERKGVTQPGFVQRVKGEGMPVKGKVDDEGKPKEWGDLFVEYEVVLPDKVEGDLQTALEKVFGKKAYKGGATAASAAEAQARARGHTEL